MQISEEGLDFIRGFESYLKKQDDGSCRAYQCQAGRWTCGWGCTEGVTATTHWTLEEAKARFATEMTKHEAAVNNIVKVPISQSQYDSLVSFSYNCGEGALANLVKPLNSGDMRATASKFSEYNKYTDPKDKKKKVSRGLVRRRAEETAIFLREECGGMPQRVSPPDRKFDVKEAILKVAAPVATVVTVAQQTAPAIPPVPEAVTQGIIQVENWKAIGGQVWILFEYGWQHPLHSLAVAVPLSILWLWPKQSEAR